MRFAGKVAIVTGAASGIGAATARRLAAEGAHVVVADIQDERGEAVAGEIRAAGGTALYYHCDVSALADWRALTDGTMRRVGRIDIVHNNAYTEIQGPTHELDELVWDRQTAVCLKSVFLSVKTCMPHLLAAEGVMINTSSVHALFGFRQRAAYGAAKGAICTLTRELAAEYGPTVRLHRQYPFTSVLPSLSTLWGPDIVSPKTVGTTKIAANGTSYLGNHDAGSGPYMLTSYQHNQKIVLKAFPGYWGGWSGRHAAEVTITWPAASSTQRLELEQGDLDATDNLSNQDVAAVAQEQGIHVIERTAQTIRDIRLNAAKGAMRSTLVRQALSDAFDYDGVVRGVYQGHATRMTGVGPTGFENFVPATHLYTFDLNKAKALLAQAGYAHTKLSFTVGYLPGDTPAIQMAQIFQSDLAKIGVTANLEGVPIATYTQIIQKVATTPDIWIGAWGMDYPDDAQEYWSYFYSKNVAPLGGNYFFYNDPTTDQELLQARKATDMNTAYRLYQKICDRVYAQALEIWPVQPNERVALRSTVHGYQYNFLYTSAYYPLYTMYRSS